MRIKILAIIILISIFSCKKEVIKKAISTTNNVLILKVDYLTNTFEGGKELTFNQSAQSFSIINQYKVPADFGNIKLIYQELNETLFDGTIIWLGTGQINFPHNIEPSNQFSIVNTTDTIYPINGFQNVFNLDNKVYDYSKVWLSIQNKIKVREYLKSNPNATVKLFLYTPSVGIGNPADWDWIIFLKN